MCGDFILIDDKKDLTINELNKILEINRTFDYPKYEKNSTMRFIKFMQEMSNT
jgi:hypothetical protein